ncbi:ATP-binding protein [Streptomyces acidiscabies]|uniref:ATP-binding protein n=2 Tax=Streptomyces TaxID=1883 RepID=A0AAP6BK87_9ACTN|nr:ATP-binding protein [Streptomyces acidiscabies]MBP5937746.1 ATP-binding protein [Streptomyces sp. LBUM 1476]MBZ3914142.1 ATP-binding protein [Streptomyces acidiscabies]MDX2966241.1 ATP-binding protein [Streptomyces acidiscabies]MDX3025606.1 ATP-binding protein [Streptomyces acidiscabies]MDX3796218.1 ATP-binding protein [Streptomyces acidiscabies]
MNGTTQRPLLRERCFRRDRRSVPAARRFALETLTGWGLASSERAHDVLLCVSELATNALLHGVPRGRQFLLSLRRDGDSVVVEVHDSGDGVPRIAQGRDGDEGGRGLVLVAALSSRWGVRERVIGKVVWCEFPLRC